MPTKNVNPKSYTVPNSTVGRKATAHTPLPTKLTSGKGTVSVNPPMKGNFGTGNAPVGVKEPMPKTKGNFGTSCAPMGSKEPAQKYKGNFGTDTPNPYKGN